MNYQGVLKDKTTRMPLNATVAAVFTFYPDLNSTGTDILSDAHPGAVVSNGLFNLQLGGGVMADGAGAGAYGSILGLSVKVPDSLSFRRWTSPDSPAGRPSRSGKERTRRSLGA